MATLQEVKDALAKLDIRSQIVDAQLPDERDPSRPVEGLNVWVGDQNARYPDDTVWPPIAGDGWVWGDRFQWGIQADADADSIAARIIETVRTRS